MIRGKHSRSPRRYWSGEYSESHITVRCTASEKANWKQMAERVRMSLSEWVRLLIEADRERIIAKDPKRSNAGDRQRRYV